jgi:23S rRNA pseudouridine1911/1915/1917 synthase
MVVAKTKVAADGLVRDIAARLIKREYLALAHGHWSHERQLSVQTDIGRDPKNRLRMAALPQGQGKWSQTDVTCLSTNDQASWLHARLHSGRTHQIRVHLAHLHHALVGDLTYGGRAVGGFERQALHAWRLSLTHPVSQEALSWTCPPPADLLSVLGQMGLGYNESLLPAP